MRLLESYDLMNEEVEWETEQSLMTNMIQVNDCLTDTISGGIAEKKRVLNEVNLNLLK